MGWRRTRGPWGWAKGDGDCHRVQRDGRPEVLAQAADFDRCFHARHGKEKPAVLSSRPRAVFAVAGTRDTSRSASPCEGRQDAPPGGPHARWRARTMATSTQGETSRAAQNADNAPSPEAQTSAQLERGVASASFQRRFSARCENPGCDAIVYCNRFRPPPLASHSGLGRSLDGGARWIGRSRCSRAWPSRG